MDEGTRARVDENARLIMRCVVFRVFFIPLDTPFETEISRSLYSSIPDLIASHDRYSTASEEKGYVHVHSLRGKWPCGPRRVYSPGRLGDSVSPRTSRAVRPPCWYPPVVDLVINISH